MGPGLYLLLIEYGSHYVVMYTYVEIVGIYQQLSNFENYFVNFLFQQQQRPDLARLMQIHAQAQAGQLAPGPGPAGLHQVPPPPHGAHQEGDDAAGVLWGHFL